VIIPVMTQHYPMLQRNLLLRTTAVVETRRMAAAWSFARIIGHAYRETSVTRPGFLDTPHVRHWLGGVEPAWTALTHDSFNTLQQEPSATNTALRLANDLTVNELNASAVAREGMHKAGVLEE
jgi:hypothetical protein